jgi:hypothetical protein
MIIDEKLKKSIAWLMVEGSKSAENNNQEVGDRVLFKTYQWEVVRTFTGKVIILTPRYGGPMIFDQSLWEWDASNTNVTNAPADLGISSIADAICLICDKHGLRYEVTAFQGELRPNAGLVGYRIVLPDAKNYEDPWMGGTWRRKNNDPEMYP